MKAILMSIRPQHACNIMNGIKTIELRERFPSDAGVLLLQKSNQRKVLRYKKCV